MRERTVQFGKTAKLVGILTKTDGDRSSERPAVILLNSGILHRVGSCRLHVKLARHLAARGFHVLRFDFSGMGDSSSRRDSLPFEESSVSEIREAMDYLASLGLANSFVLGGLCSGADAAYFAAVADTRVVGTAQLDAFAYRNARYYWNHYASRVLRVDVWKRFAGRVLGRNGGGSGGVALLENPDGPLPEDIDMPEYIREYPPREDVEKNLRLLNDRGVKQFYFYSGSMADTYNYERQFFETYRTIRFGDSVTLHYVPEADHIVTRMAHQSFVTGEIGDWAAGWWGQPEPEAADEPAMSSGALAAELRP